MAHHYVAVHAGIHSVPRFHFAREHILYHIISSPVVCGYYVGEEEAGGVNAHETENVLKVSIKWAPRAFLS